MADAQQNKPMGKWLEGLTFFDELAASGVLEDFLLEYFPDKLEQEQEFQQRIAYVLLHAEQPDSLLVDFYLLQHLRATFEAFLNGVAQCSRSKRL